MCMIVIKNAYNMTTGYEISEYMGREKVYGVKTNSKIYM